MKNMLCSLSIMLLVVLLASRLCSEDIYSDNIVIILDGSGSMGDPMKSSQKFSFPFCLDITFFIHPPGVQNLAKEKLADKMDI